MKDIIQPVKGTRDFYPVEKAINTWLHETIRSVSESFGYQEYDAPFLESIELYAAKSGEELVKEQAFVFPDKSDNLITLRPELTPSLVRMIAQRQQQLYYPLRWWSYGPFWRYESPQKGRGREFFQWNADLIGVDSPEADAEMAALMAVFFQRLDLSPDQVQVLTNNRRLMDREIQKIGIPIEERGSVFKLIDRREKMDPESWKAFALDLGLSEKQFSGIEDLLANQNLWKESEELVRFFEAVDALGVAEYVSFAPQIIRGLDYYTGTVVEAQAISAEVRRSIAGGGRYDNLLEDVGGSSLPGVGFAMGDMVVLVVLEELGLLPDQMDRSPAEVLVTVFDDDSLLESYRLASQIRSSGIDVVTYPEPDKLGKQFRHADRIGSRVAAILGPDEIAQDKVALKNLATRDQIEVPRDQVSKAILDLLDKAHSA